MKKMLATALIVMSAWTYTPVAAEPLYLQCQLTNREETPQHDAEILDFALLLDEHSGTVTQTWGDNSTSMYTAVFGAAIVSYQHSQETDTLTITSRYELNRASLEIARQVTIQQRSAPIDTNTSLYSNQKSGRCQRVGHNPHKV